MLILIKYELTIYYAILLITYYVLQIVSSSHIKQFKDILIHLISII